MCRHVEVRSYKKTYGVDSLAYSASLQDVACFPHMLQERSSIIMWEKVIRCHAVAVHVRLWAHISYEDNTEIKN